mgnify:CR=1 FL=1|tara:strand:- start:368 stop:844 length:477 start_codon:yes stop_codon:yes gene_type:complete
MAHFAKISDTSKVLTVLALDNKDMLNADGIEEESVGQKYLEKHNNWPAQMWIQTSCNTRGGKHYDNKTGELSADQSKALRGNYAATGYIWDEDNSLFYLKKPYASWVLNTSEARWQSPIGDEPALPSEQQSQNEGGTHRWNYIWNETDQSWDLTDTQT